MKNNLELIGLFIEQNTNEEILLIISAVFLLPAMVISLLRYAKVIITGNDFKIFNK